MTSLLLDTHLDLNEPDELVLAQRVTFERNRAMGPVLTFNGPDGEVQIVGWEACTQLSKALADQLRFFAADVSKMVEAA